MAAVNMYEAKATLSSLVERAIAGEEVILAKAGKPLVRLVPVVPEERSAKRLSGGNDLGITYIAPDFDDPIWTDEELEEMGLA